jgi:DNA-binding response OmpR family regulator
MEEKQILVVDDDVNICRFIEMYLVNENFRVFLAHDGQSALDIIAGKSIDLVILDIMLPVIDGWEVCKTIRKTSQIPVIMLTARDMLEDKLQGFDFGADDYMVKPFETKELVARVKARLKDRPAEDDSNAPPVLSVGNLTVDLGRYQVKRGKDSIDLKPKEIQLLYFLLKNKNLVFSREQLLEKVWGYTYYGDTRTVDVHIKRLREKLDIPENDWQIKTVWGVGYKLEVS